MARVVSSCAALLAQRRGLSTAAITVAEGSAKKVEEKAVKLGTVAKDITTAVATTTEERTAFWEPDPETGYYRPVTGTKEVDAADLRAEMLKQRVLQERCSMLRLQIHAAHPPVPLGATTFHP